MKKLLGLLRRIITDYNMLGEGDRVAVGVSGKDSITLLYALHLYQKFSPQNFELEAITVDLGFPDFNVGPIQNFCQSIGVPYTIKETQIAQIVFEERKEKNPCSLCSKMRKGALHNCMQERGLNVLALGHHADDAIETFLMNMLYTGRLSTFSSTAYLSRKEIQLIRPFIFAWEKDIVYAFNKHNLPELFNPCPVDKKTNREKTKELVRHLCKTNPDAKTNLLTALRNKEQAQLWF